MDHPPELVKAIQGALRRAYQQGFAEGESGAFDAPLDNSISHAAKAYEILDKYLPRTTTDKKGE